MKVGIITHYYNSINYGGNLQAYALTQFLNKNSIEAEQISYDKNAGARSSRITNTDYRKRFFQKAKRAPKVIWNRVRKKRFQKEYNEIIRLRRAAFVEFNRNRIPHSNETYDLSSIENCVDKYDIFITGSDQVWNLNWYDAAYFLDFVPSNKKKCSYAASFSMDSFNKEQKIIVQEHLRDYSAISVREQQAIQLLKGKTSIEPVLVVDPTLLLEKADWEQVCSERFVDENYVFAYFLSGNKRARKMAETYAKQNGYKLVAIVYASGNLSIPNSKYGDIQLIDVGPEQFLSLIKHAEYIFTDSFHAVVFSIIFQKQFLVFNRDVKGSMNSRITSLTDMFDMQERFCATRQQESMSYIEGLKEINYKRKFTKFEEIRGKSYEFIRKNILEYE